MLEEALPVTDRFLTPPWAEGVAEDYEFFGVSIDETRDFAAQALTRRLKVIGLVQRLYVRPSGGGVARRPAADFLADPPPAGRRGLQLPHFGSS